MTPSSDATLRRKCGRPQSPLTNTIVRRSTGSEHPGRLKPPHFGVDPSWVMLSSPPATGTHRVMVIEDAPEFRTLIESVLRSDGFRVQTLTTGEEGIEWARRHRPDVVILDVGLPGIDGIEVCRRIRSFSDAYVVMLTGRDEEVDKLIGLAVGADDYVTKPFSPRELSARIRALLRRPRAIETDESGPIEIGDLVIDVGGREVLVGGQPVELTKIEFDLLSTLASRPDMVFARAVLIEHVWGPDWIGDDHMVEVHIGNLRRKIDTDTKHIRTVRGVGYRMAGPRRPKTPFS